LFLFYSLLDCTGGIFVLLAPLIQFRTYFIFQSAKKLMAKLLKKFFVTSPTLFVNEGSLESSSGFQKKTFTIPNEDE
jgi:hypothetical protein